MKNPLYFGIISKRIFNIMFSDKSGEESVKSDGDSARTGKYLSYFQPVYHYVMKTDPANTNLSQTVKLVNGRVGPTIYITPMESFFYIYLLFSFYFWFLES